MAEIAFHYINTFSYFHRLDPRSKLILLLGFSAVGSVCPSLGLLILIPSVLVALIPVRISIRRLFRELRAFMVFFLFIILISAIDISFASSKPEIALDASGFLNGFVTVMRMLFIILLAVFFTSTTKTREMRDAAWWLFHRVPAINAARIATMFSLSIRFIPLLFEQASQIGRALAARGTSRKPLKRLRLTAFPLIVNSFRRVDMISTAMISRCYTDDAIRPKFSFTRRDAITLVCSAGICVGALLL